MWTLTPRQDLRLPVHISSRNNFPIAAGLASSASGFTALVASLFALYQLPTDASRLSLIARQGSACLSLFAGFVTVAWQMGERADGTDSYAVQERHWTRTNRCMNTSRWRWKSVSQRARLSPNTLRACSSHHLSQTPHFNYL